MSRLNSADCAGRPEDVLFDERCPTHSAHPAADAKLALESGFIELNLFQSFRVFRRHGRDVRREAVNRDDAFRRDDRGERLHEPPRGVRHNASPLRVQVCARAVGAKLKEGDALEAEADDEALLRV